MTGADTLMLERLVRRAERYPHEFTPWELDRLEEWAGHTDLTPAQITVLTRVDLRTA